MTDEKDLEIIDIRDPEVVEQSELEALKKRADLMGLKYHHRIGVKKLKAAVTAALDTENIEDAQELLSQNEKESKLTELITNTVGKETVQQRLARNRKEAGKLIRIRVSNMNPNKKEWEGEIYTVSNAVAGTFKKYVPFNNEEGWHVPQIILNHMQEKQCQIFHTVKYPNGQKVREGKLIKELNIEILPPLTVIEYKDLAQRQAMARGTA